MNMNDAPTADHLLTLITPMDGQARGKKPWGDMLVRYPMLDQRSVYGGPEASVNGKWIARLLRELVQDLAERKRGTVHYLGLSLVQGLAK